MAVNGLVSLYKFIIHYKLKERKTNESHDNSKFW